MLSNIYNKLMDEESKRIFELRLLYSLTGEKQHINNLVAEMNIVKEIKRKIFLCGRGEKAVLWGAGYWGDIIKNVFSDIEWECFVDNNKRETEKNGILVCSPEEYLKKYKNRVVVITSNLYNEEIYQQLLSYQIDKELIINIGKMTNEMLNNQYFDLPFLTHEDDEVFIDAGCFDGGTVQNFLKWTGGKYKEILSFEPDGICYDKCKKILADVPNCSLVNAGLYSREDTMYFHENGKASSHITEEGEIQIHTVRLDEIAKEKKVTFIKMDIEGSEKEALLGAENIIRNQKPKLAICIYHKKEDIWEIPRVILEMNPNYQFYIRHYQWYETETILYAV